MNKINVSIYIVLKIIWYLIRLVLIIGFIVIYFIWKVITGMAENY